MRLLHVFHSFALGGSQARLIRLIDTFGDEFEHVIVSLTGDVSATSLIQRADRVRFIDGRPLMKATPFAWPGIRKVLREHAPDRLLTYNWGAIDWAISALGSGIPHIAVEDGFGPEESVRRLYRRSLTRRLVFGMARSELMVPSRTLADIARSEWGMPEVRVHLVPNGVSPDPYRVVHQRGRPSVFSRDGRETVIGTLAGLRSEKSLDRMIEAFRKIVAVRPARLVIAGTGPLESSLRELCEKFGLGDAVHFEGFRSDPAAFLHELDLFMLSSQTEQLPISLIEAMLSGLPAVSTDVGDVRASLPFEQRSYVVERDADALARAALAILALPDGGGSLGRANRQHAIDHFGPQAMLSAWRRAFSGSSSLPPKAAPSRKPINADQPQAPHIIVFSSLFPSAVSPQAGIFIKERMFRVARHLPMTVVSPQPWSPLDGLIRIRRPAFRLSGPRHEVMEGVAVRRPRFLSMPGMFKGADAFSMSFAARRVVREISQSHPHCILDAHFAYPDGLAASRLSASLDIPMTLTLRGSKDSLLLGTAREPQVKRAVLAAQRVFAVSDALRDQFSDRFNLPEGAVELVRNGVDTDRFKPVDRAEARTRLGISSGTKVILSVGWLVEGKGHHRLLPIVSRLAQLHPDLLLLIVGGNAGGDDGHARLQSLATSLGIGERVRLCGVQPATALKWFYGAADVFALATRTEGWANVLLESMACGLPVVTTRVGGNPQVVSSERLGILVDFWDETAFERALSEALFERVWDTDALVGYAASAGWDAPVATLVSRFTQLSGRVQNCDGNQDRQQVMA
jgi:glycosyltransferase involved in cell wall biosynthesis